jgi:hypothetical protein
MWFSFFSINRKKMEIQSRLSIEKCRGLIGNNEAYSDGQIEKVRDTFYVLANLIADKIIAIKNAFIRCFQTISCKGFIVK